MDIEYFVNLRPVLLLQLEEVVAFGTGASTRMELGMFTAVRSRNRRNWGVEREVRMIIAEL